VKQLLTPGERGQVGLCALTLLFAAPALASPAAPLQKRLEAIAQQVPGKLGIAVLDLDRGTRTAVHGDVPAPMASVFKLPLAVAVLRTTQEQGIPLTVPVHVAWEERNPGWSPLAERVLLRWMKGPEAVMRVLRRLKADGLRIDRSERALAEALWGLPPPEKPEPLEGLLARMERVPKERHLESMKRFSSDPRDQASPVALVDLLSALEAGKLLDPAHTSRLLQWMRESPTGAAQLRAGLPADVVLAHKTGQVSSLGFTVALNDVGIATGNGRRLAIAVVLTDVEAPLERCQAVIAEVGRTVWNELGSAAAPR